MNHREHRARREHQGSTAAALAEDGHSTANVPHRYRFRKRAKFALIVLIWPSWNLIVTS